MAEDGKSLFLNTYINNLTEAEAIEGLCQAVKDKKKTFVVYVNSDVIIKIEQEPYLKEIVDSADMVLTDGMPLIWISHFHRKPIKEKISGSDMVPRLCEAAWREGYSIFLLGGAEKVPQQAADKLKKRFSGIKIAGAYSPRFGFEKDAGELEKIRDMISAAQPDILIVCLGCPKQEKFIYENMNQYQATVSVCAGATIDFLAGNVKRCPGWMSRTGFEWLYRFMKEPKRLFRRYFIDDIRIFALALKYHPRKKRKKLRVLMCGSDLRRVKGGMVTVAGNYLGCKEWKYSDIMYIPTHVEGGKAKKLIFFIIGYMRVLLICCFSRPSVIHLHTSERGSIRRKSVIMKLCHGFGVPVILHHHGAEFDNVYDRLDESGKKFIRGVLGEADLNLVLSEKRVNSIRQKAPGAKVDYLYNSVERKINNPYHPKARRILALGRLGERKGTYDLLRAFRDIDGELPEDVTLWLCGDGEAERVKKLVKEYGLEHRVKHVGWIGGGKKEECLRQGMLHILPSYFEGLPMSILETMSYGIPNISTRIASIPEAIEDSVDGILITPGDVEELKRNILLLIRDEGRRCAMSKKAYEKIAEKFSHEIGIARLEAIYLKLTNKREEDC